MSVYQITIPAKAGITDFELKMMVASKLFNDGKLSSGEAAEIVGLSKRSFIELLGKYDVSLFSSELNELEEDIANA